MTKRDDVWDEAIDQLMTKGKFRISDLDFDDESEKYTAKRVLRDMERKGWLSRTSEQSPIWRLGPKAKVSLNISSDVIEEAEPD